MLCGFWKSAVCRLIDALCASQKAQETSLKQECLMLLPRRYECSLTQWTSASLKAECYGTGGKQETEGGRGKGEQGEAGAGGSG